EAKTETAGWELLSERLPFNLTDRTQWQARVISEDLGFAAGAPAFAYRNLEYFSDDGMGWPERVGLPNREGGWIGLPLGSLGKGDLEVTFRMLSFDYGAAAGSA